MTLQIATGDLAAKPATREELQALYIAEHEQRVQAEEELYKLRKWVDAMPTRETIYVSRNVKLWMLERPEVGA